MRGLVLLLACLSVGLTADEARLSLALTGRPADSTIATINAIGPFKVVLDADMLEAERLGRHLALHLVDDDRTTLAQVLAHALDCWWYLDRQRRIHLTASDRIPAAGPLKVRTFTWQAGGDEDTGPRLRQIMAPWLSDLAGLDFHPGMQRWSAALDDRGHRRLLAILGQLEQPRLYLPPQIRHPAHPTTNAVVGQAISATTWADLAQLLAPASGRAIALAPDLPAMPVGGLSLPPQRLHELPSQLIRFGIQAAWIHGCLCIGRDLPTDRQHPAQALHLGCVRIPGWNPTRDDSVKAELHRVRIEQQVRPTSWTQAGRAIIPLPQTGMLLIQAEPDLLAAIADHLRQRSLQVP